MGFTLFSPTLRLTGLIVAVTTILPILPAPAYSMAGDGAIAVPAQTLGPDLDPALAPSWAKASATPLAQAGGTYAPVGCRITRQQVGVYQEPSLSDTALGLIAKDVTVTLGTGSGSGWARIVAPQTGWIQAKFLRGNGSTACPPGQKPVVPVASPPPPAATSPAPRAGENGSVTRAICAVLPEAGLIVRDQPNLNNSRVIGSIRAGNYTFQFTGQRRRDEGESQRQWAYITAPAKGWISTGIVGGGSNLTGEGCI